MKHKVQVSYRSLCALLFVALSSIASYSNVVTDQQTDAIWIELLAPGHILRLQADKCDTAPKLHQELSSGIEYERRLKGDFSKMQAKLKSRIETAKGITPIDGSEIYWAEKNKDGTLAAVCFDNPLVSNDVTLSVVRLVDEHSLLNVRLKERLCDVMWCPYEPRKLVVLSANSKLAWSIGGLFRLLSGHPEQDTSFTLRIFDMDSGKVIQYSLAETLKNANGIFMN